MKRIVVLLVVLQGIAICSHANAQVVETRTESFTATRKDGRHVSTQTETSTYVGGVYTYTGTNTRTELFFGLRLDMNASGFLLKNLPDRESAMNAGGSFGGFMRIEFQRGFAMQPELVVHYKTSVLKNNHTGTELDYRYWGVEIPVYYMGRINLGQGKGFIGAGPYVGFGIDAQYVTAGGNWIDLYKEGGIMGEKPMQRWDFGFGGRLTYEFGFGLQINIGYKIGVINALDAGRKDYSMLPHTVSWGVGFRL